MAQQSITLQTGDASVTPGDIIGRIGFAASNESDGAESRWIAASIYAQATGEFTASVNPTNLVFATSDSDGVTPRFKITNVGHFLPNLNATYELGSSSFKFNNIYATTGTLDRIVTTGIQLTQSVSRSGLLYVNDNDLVASSPNVLFSNSDLASPKLIFKSSGSLTPDLSLNVLTSATNVTSGVQTLSVQGSAGELFSITDVLDSGTIFSVNDISGLELIGADADGSVRLAKYGTNVAVGNVAATEKLHVDGNIRVSGAYYDSTNSPGTSGQVLVSTSGGTDWRSLGEITGVDGVGTSGYVARWIDTDTISSGIIYDNGTNVGIGTTSPTSQLHIEASSATTTGVIIRGAAAQTADLLQIQNSAGTTLLDVDAAGSISGVGSGIFMQRVGIGTSAPAYKLDIVTSGQTYDGIRLRTASNIQTASLINGNSDTTPVGMLVLSYGNTSPAFVKADSNSLFLRGGDNNGGYITFNPTTVGSTTTEIMRVNQTGVGIGTTAPTQRLDVRGTGYFSESIRTSGTMVFASGNTAPVGVMEWDNGEGTVSLGLKGGNVNLEVGQEQLSLCYNGTPDPISKGKVVYINGAQGQKPSITLASNNSEATSSKTFGVVAEDILSGAEGFVATYGTVRNLDTSSFPEGSGLWLDTSGNMTIYKPVQPLHSVFIGYALKNSASAGRIFVRVQNGFELQELHNVLIDGVASGDLIQYDSSSNLWKNRSLADAGAVGGVGSSGYVAKWNSTTTVGTGLIYDNGTNVGIGTTSPAAKLEIKNNDGAATETVNKLSIRGGVGGDNQIMKVEYIGDAGILTIGYAGLTSFKSGMAGGISGGSSNFFLGKGATTYVNIRASGDTYFNGGNVAIGHTSPTSQLHVNTSSSTVTGIIVRGAASQTADLFQAQNSAGTALTRIFADGSISGVASGIFMQRIGVGVSNPAYGIEVSGDGAIRNTLYVGPSTSQIGIIGLDTSNRGQMGNNAQTIEPNNGASNLRILTPITGGNGTISIGYWKSGLAQQWNRALSISNTPTVPHLMLQPDVGGTMIGTATDIGSTLGIRGSGATSATTAFLIQDSGGSNLLKVDNAGNVGIGTTSPNYTLHVNGSGYISGDVVIGGDVTIMGTTVSVNVDTMTVEDPILTLGLASGAVVSDVNLDRGLALALSDSETAFMGWDTSENEFALLSSGIAQNSSGNYVAGTYGDLRIGGLTATTANFSSTIDAANLGAGVDDSVVILDSDGKLRTDEIDSRVWGSTLVDGAGSAGHIAYWTDANTLSYDSSQLYWDSSNNRLGIGTTSPSYQVEIKNSGANALLVLNRTDGAACFIEGQATRSAFGSVGATPLALAYNSLAVVTIGAAGAITVNPDGDGFTFPTTDGSANQVLKTDGAGTLSWAEGIDGSGIANYVARWTDANTIGTGVIYDNGNVGIGTTNPQYLLDVSGTIRANHVTAITKSFLIDHPTKPGRQLRYASLEGPENGVYVRGSASGNYIVLPEYWCELVDSRSITVNLTPVGEPQQLWVKSKNVHYIEVGGVEGVYDYTVWGERKDVAKLEVET